MAPNLYDFLDPLRVEFEPGGALDRMFGVPEAGMTLDPEEEEGIRAAAIASGQDPDEAARRLLETRKRASYGGRLSKFAEAQEMNVGARGAGSNPLTDVYSALNTGMLEKGKAANLMTGQAPPPTATVTTEESDFRIDPSAIPATPIDAASLKATEHRLWGEQTAGRQYDYDKIAYIQRLQDMAGDPNMVPGLAGRADVPGMTPGATLHGEGPTLTPKESIERRVGMTREEKEQVPQAFRGKHFRGGKQYRPTPEHLQGVGGAAATAAARGQRGAFTASRQLPSLDVSPEFVMETESPAVQRLWEQNRMKQFGFDLQDAGLEQEQARAGILLAEAKDANLPYEQRIKRMFEGITMMHEAMKDRLMPNVQAQVDRQMTLLATDPDGLAMIDTPEKKKAMEALYFKQFQNSTFTNMMNIMFQMKVLLAQDPSASGAASIMQEQARQAMFSGGGAIPPMPTTP